MFSCCTGSTRCLGCGKQELGIYLVKVLFPTQRSERALPVVRNQCQSCHSRRAGTTHSISLCEKGAAPCIALQCLNCFPTNNHLTTVADTKRVQRHLPSELVFCLQSCQNSHARTMVGPWEPQNPWIALLFMFRFLFRPLSLSLVTTNKAVCQKKRSNVYLR